MGRLAFLSMDSLEGFITDDELLYQPLADLGWQVTDVSWRDRSVNWSDFDIVLIRTPWDYQQEPEAFFAVLADIEASDATLLNPLETVRWNINKNYLFELEEKGVQLVPTKKLENATATDLLPLYENWNTTELVIKPIVGANADDTFRLPKPQFNQRWSEVADTFKDRIALVQPFVESVPIEGEYSVLFFGGKYSHTALKVPKENDFRVQEEHGGLPYGVEAEAALLESAKFAISLVEPEPLYARIDFVRLPDQSFGLMELELIEPALYLRMDENSPQRFAQAITDWWQQNK